MASFDSAIEQVLLNEGGYVDNPHDPGGRTKYGITQGDHPDLDIQNLTIEDAKGIYRKNYWLDIYDGIAEQAVANKVFDAAVNSGHSQAHKLLQRSLRFLGKNVDVDGVVGPGTLTATNGVAPYDLLNEFRAQQAMFYFNLVQADASKQSFLLGWIRRVMR
jgi:lysozyme family protein